MNKFITALIKNLFGVNQEFIEENVSLEESSTPAITYVDKVLFEMIHNNCFSKIITEKDLAGVVVNKEKVEYSHVLNRLKFMCSLNPCQYNTEQVGQMELLVNKTRYLAQITVEPHGISIKI